MEPVIQIENLSKMYRLGVIGTGTISHDLNRWWHKVRGKEDPYLKIGESNIGNEKSSSEYVWAIKDINLEVNKGDVMGIIGKNGAGKSTLLKILSKVTGPTTGNIKYNGRIGSLLEVGTGFHPELTGRENIYLNGAILGMTKSEIRLKLDEIIDFAGVNRYVDTPVKRYSSGMKVRLGFAVAAHLEPEILVVDEVLAVGDAEFQKKAIGKMKDVSHKEGRTVLFVSHNMASIQNLCSTLVVLESGTISFNGNVKQGIQQYLLSAKSETENNLASRKDRIGGVKFKFTHVEIYSGSGLNKLEPQTGENLYMKISYQAIEEMKNVLLRIIVLADNGEIKFVCNNNHSSNLFNEIRRKGYFICYIPKLRLIGGNYSIHLRCVSQKEIVDEIEFASSFSVVEGDFFKTGKIPSINSVLVEHKIDYHTI